MTEGNRPILLAEDDPNDVLLMRYAFRRLGLEDRLICCDNGETFIRNLLHVREANQMPALCILDIKMPRANGFQTLRWLRSREEFRTLPVVIMSASGAPSDMHLAKTFGADEYLVKPLALQTLCTTVAELAKRWKLREDE